MRVVVNLNRCMGWGVCYTHAPEIYQPDEEGFCVVVKPFVGERLAEKALEGASVCPERAIRVELCEDTPGSVDDSSVRADSATV